MAKCLTIMIRLLGIFNDMIVKHVSRIKNEKANALAKIALGYKVNKYRFVEMIDYQEHLELIELKEVFCANSKDNINQLIKQLKCTYNKILEPTFD